MNNTIANITLLTLGTGSLGGVLPAIQAHDYVVAASMLVFGLVMILVYEKMPPTVQ